MSSTVQFDGHHKHAFDSKQHALSALEGFLAGLLLYAFAFLIFSALVWILQNVK